MTRAPFTAAPRSVTNWPRRSCSASEFNEDASAPTGSSVVLFIFGLLCVVHTDWLVCYSGKKGRSLGGLSVEGGHGEAEGANGFGNAGGVTVRPGEDNGSFKGPEKLIGELVGGGSLLAIAVSNQRL